MRDRTLAFIKIHVKTDFFTLFINKEIDLLLDNSANDFTVSLWTCSVLPFNGHFISAQDVEAA